MKTMMRHGTCCLRDPVSRRRRQIIDLLGASYPSPGTCFRSWLKEVDPPLAVDTIKESLSKASLQPTLQKSLRFQIRWNASILIHLHSVLLCSKRNENDPFVPLNSPFFRTCSYKKPFSFCLMLNACLSTFSLIT